MAENDFGLNGLLKKFRGKKTEEAEGSNAAPERDSKQKLPHCGAKSCVYCGRTDEMALITVGRNGENICPDCGENLVMHQYQCHRIADETAHNIEYMFSIPWNKYLKVKNTDTLWRRALKKKQKETRVKKNRIDRVGMESSIVRMKKASQKGGYDLKIRRNIPAGNIIAEMAYIIIKDYLTAVSDGISLEKTEGLAAWYTVHYLYKMDYPQYGDYYDMIAEEEAWKGAKTYKDLREIQSPDSSEIMPLSWGIEKLFEKKEVLL